VKRSDEHAHEAPASDDTAEIPVDSSELLDKVVRAVEQHWNVVVEPGSNHDLRYLDTFDWRLYRAGRTLYATRGRRSRKLVLANIGGEVLQTVAGVGPATFARGLPPPVGSVRQSGRCRSQLPVCYIQQLIGNTVTFRQ
jgi:hypothetical protein